MNVTVELVIYVTACVAGLVTSGLALKMAATRVRSLMEVRQSQGVIESARHLRSTELERVIGWGMFLLAGLISAHEPPAQNPSSVLVRVLILATVALWSYKTVTDYLFTRRQLRRALDELKNRYC